MAEAKKNRISGKGIWIGAIVCLVLIFWGVRHWTRPRLLVRVAAAETGNLVKTISTNGKVEPVANFAAHAPDATTVKALYVHEGDKVAKGQLLLELDEADARSRVAAALAAVRGAEANLDALKNGGTQQQQIALSGNLTQARMQRQQAAASLATVEKLGAQGAAAPSEVAAAKQRLAVAESALASLEKQKSHPYASADLEHAQAALADARAGYAAAEQVIRDSNVRAPFAGTVYSLPVARYEYVQPGATLVQEADLADLRVRAYFDEPEIGGLSVGNPVSIVWDAKPNLRWHGRIVRLPSTIITYGTRNVGEVLVSVDDADGILLPNTNVTVTVTTERVDDALTVPREALHIEGGKNYVYQVEGGSLHRREVKVGAINLTQVQILSGLKGRETVALGATNGAPITEGVPIQIVK